MFKGRPPFHNCSGENSEVYTAKKLWKTDSDDGKILGRRPHPRAVKILITYLDKKPKTQLSKLNAKGHVNCSCHDEMTGHERMPIHRMRKVHRIVYR